MATAAGPDARPSLTPKERGPLGPHSSKPATTAGPRFRVLPLEPAPRRTAHSVEGGTPVREDNPEVVPGLILGPGFKDRRPLRLRLADGDFDDCVFGAVGVDKPQLLASLPASRSPYRNHELPHESDATPAAKAELTNRPLFSVSAVLLPALPATGGPGPPDRTPFFGFAAGFVRRVDGRRFEQVLLADDGPGGDAPQGAVGRRVDEDRPLGE